MIKVTGVTEIHVAQRDLDLYRRMRRFPYEEKKRRENWSNRKKIPFCFFVRLMSLMTKRLLSGLGFLLTSSFVGSLPQADNSINRCDE